MADQRSRAARILAALPQTQCQRCGYPDCAAYAQAIADGQAAINQCPPGGAEGVQRLAALTGQPALPLNPEHGAEGPRHVAWIDEAWCIGCTLCIKACPVDCIVGGNKRMHTVIDDWCTALAEFTTPAQPPTGTVPVASLVLRGPDGRIRHADFTDEVLPSRRRPGLWQAHFELFDCPLSTVTGEAWLWWGEPQ